MQGKCIPRVLEKKVNKLLMDFPVTAILGPRQSGKSTLAKKIISKISNSIYIDLEKPSDLRKLNEPELFFSLHKNKLICLDEIQRTPELFSILRSIVDDENHNQQFLILGSASRDLIKQSSETLAGRIAFLELVPFIFSEVKDAEKGVENIFNKYWIRGGFPRSFLAQDDENSIVWRENFIKTFLERDIPQLGFQIPAETIRRLWMMCANSHGQLLNSSKLGEALGMSHTTIRSYTDLLCQTFMIRLLQPVLPNIKKRLVKSPKIFIRDHGILHTLLEIDSMDNLLGNPVYGHSWEGLVIENILTEFPQWRAGFYRTSSGAELDLVLMRGNKKIAIEAKASLAPIPTKGFWNAMKDLQVDEAWIISPIQEMYPINKNVYVSGLLQFVSYLKKTVSF